jgi:hypothetical protein
MDRVKICEFTLAYKPNPQTTSELDTDGSLVNGRQRIGNESVVKEISSP